ncbi:hypothetical protein GO755_26505 [Spirosoma sp. HMF4905]|uniref:Uncharacterized protein n=1 Tax=Spirosoma arboris TaxID=2682092 RepID=A0A7K1SIR5_9BACT|nr:hypothetical protein [Spirosoma arboris]MVM33618.1 hypothetical protein [Spirosoma arboris]
MKTNFFLVVNSKGSIKALKTKPGLNWDEIAISVSLNLPTSLFQKPQLNAVIDVPDTAIQPLTIETDVANNIQGAIEQATGYEVRLTLNTTPEK